MPLLIGTAPNQVPTNSDLGTMAFQDENAVKILGGSVVVSDVTASSSYQDTAISNVPPSLNLDFVYGMALDPRVTFARASTATFYDGKTVAKAEENLALYSQDISNAVWGVGSTTKSINTTTAPDGSVTAGTITAVAGAASHYILQTILGAASPIRTVSFYAKAGTHNFVQILFGTDTLTYANFNITAGAGAVGTVGSAATATIVDAGNGWYRCIIYVNSATATVTTYLTLVSSATAVRAESWTPVGTETVHVWGIQCENRSAVSAYTPTTTQAITNYIPALQTAAQNQPRFDCDPLTGERNGLLIEESRTNILLYSEQLDNGVWGGSSVATAVVNSGTSPDGANNATKIIPTATTAAHLRNQTLSFTSGTTYAFSVYAKANGWSTLQLTVGSAAFSGLQYGNYDLTTGIATAGNSATVSMSPVGNGWYRCSIVIAATATASTVIGYGVYNTTNPTRQVSVLGDGFNGILMWGAQVEAGAFPTSYIPTVASQVTRSADSAVMTGTNFSSWYRADEGTIYWEAAINSPASTCGMWAIGDSSLAFVSRNSIISTSFSATGQWGMAVAASGVSQIVAPIPSVYYVANTVKRTAFTFKTNDMVGAADGVVGIVDTVATVPTGLYGISLGSLAQAYIGGGANALNGWIKRLVYFPKRLADAELQEMTK